jgi:hypothetical protein
VLLDWKLSSTCSCCCCCCSCWKRSSMSCLPWKKKRHSIVTWMPGGGEGPLEQHEIVYASSLRPSFPGSTRLTTPFVKDRVGLSERQIGFRIASSKDMRREGRRRRFSVLLRRKNPEGVLPRKTRTVL